MVRLVVARENTAILSSLCAECPYSPAGCCTAPPRLALFDVARIVRLGGRDWLLAEIGAGRLVIKEQWLVIERRKKVPRPGSARVAACIYHGDRGCTIDAARRPATCNYYVCDEALAQGGPDAPRARAVHAELVDRLSRWDAELARRVEAEWPYRPLFDGAFLDWLAAASVELSG